MTTARLPFARIVAAQVFWTSLRPVFWAVGVVLLLLLLLAPRIGITLVWNVLIPVAPALLVVATGIWRNVCPLATTSLLPERLGLSRGVKLSLAHRTLLNVVGVTSLLLLIPLRHLVFNTSGAATGLLLLVIAMVAVVAGILFERKSGWCAGLCPIHPVEKLYGSGVAWAPPNAHCGQCVRCTVPCPDSTANTNALALPNSGTSKACEYLMVGLFPGYVWGWFQVPDMTSSFGWQDLQTVYGYPLLGGGHHAVPVFCLAPRH